MRKKFKIIASLSLVLLSSSCYKDSIKTESTDVNGIRLELLFEKDGCKMYRFRDGGRMVYWSDCSGRSSYEYTTSNGKTSSTHRVHSLTD